ncbi:Multiple stress resistance protein BhsA precursor [Pragia fontium]|uniref:multiple stress resistance protein BhsA n=1 Tax=Pragia fontium TaxID=82985 RepID=UPI000DF88375|nr:YdgH/BhsA/McbA-like domain containing protein [Pragia fontium]SUB81798.1 Multiple stress resistance protein BhsA precursor [Pragia fontium]
MKNVKLIATAAVLATLSFSSFAAQQVTRDQTENLDKIGSVSVSNSHGMSALEHKLAAKAEAQGASRYYIVSASTGNNMRGTAIIYK